MSISSEHPHDMRVTANRLLGAMIFLVVLGIILTLWIGMGRPDFNIPIPGVSFLEVVSWRIHEVDVRAIPLAISMAVFLATQVINHLVHRTRYGVTGGELAFAILGTWVGSTFALAAQGSEYTQQALTWYGSGLTTAVFVLLAILTRNLR